MDGALNGYAIFRFTCSIIIIIIIIIIIVIVIVIIISLMRMGCGEFLHKKSGTDLCEAIAAKTRRLCTECIDPVGIEAILANRLIPLDKGEGAVGWSVSAKLFGE